MEGFNPDQSLIPSVGGSITPMSGGGQRGGEPNPPPEDGHNIVGLDVEGFKNHTMGTILKILAPSIFSSVTDLGQYWNDNRTSNNSDIKEAIFKTLIDKYLNDVEGGLTIETADEDVEEDFIKEHLIQDTSMSFVDISNTQMKFDIANQLLTIEILTKIPKKPVVGGGMFDSEEEDSFGDNSSDEEYSESAAEEDSFRENSSDEEDLEDEGSNDLFISEVEEEGEFESESSSDSESE